MNKTQISWTSLSWNPMSGCRAKSAGCEFCYARALAENKRGTPAFPNGFDLTIRPHKLKEPARLKEPSTIFVNSMSDPFWEEIPTDYLDRIFDVMESTPRHLFQVLTKRADRLLEYSKRRPFAPHIAAGVTIENEATTWRADALRESSATLRFVSVEPLLSPLTGLDVRGLNQIIVGGESGVHLVDPAVATRRSLAVKVDGKWLPREGRIGWVRGLRDRCQAAGVPFWFKQWGGVRPKSAGNELDGVVIHEPLARPGGRAQLRLVG